MIQCENCLHKKICDLWEEIDGRAAGGYCDICDYFDGIPVETVTLFTEDTYASIMDSIRDMANKRNAPLTLDELRQMDGGGDNATA